MDEERQRPKSLYREWLDELQGKGNRESESFGLKPISVPRPEDVPLPRTWRARFFTAEQAVASTLGFILVPILFGLSSAVFDFEEDEVAFAVFGFVVSALAAVLTVYVSRATVTADEVGIQHRVLWRTFRMSWGELHGITDRLALRGSQLKRLWLFGFDSAALELLAIIESNRPELYEEFVRRPINGFVPNDEGLTLKPPQFMTMGSTWVMSGILLVAGAICSYFAPYLSWYLAAGFFAVAVVLVIAFSIYWRSSIREIRFAPDIVTLLRGYQRSEFQSEELRSVTLLVRAGSPAGIEIRLGDRAYRFESWKTLAAYRSFCYVRDMYGL